MSCLVPTSRAALRALVLAALLGLLAVATLAIPARGRAAHDYPDIRGTWTGYACIGVSLAECRQHGEYAQNFTVSAENFSNGQVTIEGNGPIGQITGDTLQINWPESGGYLSTNTYKISPCGDSMAGTFSDNYGRSGEPIWVEKVSEDEEGEDGEARAARASRADPGAKSCKVKVTLSGTVRRHLCVDSDGGCTQPKVAPAAERPIQVVDGKGKSYDTETNAKGVWQVKVPAGKPYTIRAVGGNSFPASRSVRARGDLTNLDFTYCKIPDNFPSSVGCDLVRVDVSLLDQNGAPYGEGVINGPGDSATIGKSGTATLYLPRGTDKITVSQVGFEGTYIPGRVFFAGGTSDLQKDVNSVTLTAKPTFAPFIGDEDAKQLTLAITGLPEAGVESPLRYSLESPHGSRCQKKQSGEFPLGKGGHSAATVITPESYFRFCDGRYKLKVYSGSGLFLAETSLRIIS